MADDVTALRIKVLSDDVEAAKRRLDDLTTTSDKNERSVKSLGSTMATSMRNFAAGALTVGALTAAVGANVKNWQAYDKSMKEVSSIMGASRKEFQDLREDVVKLSVSMGVDATIAAKGLYQAISAGIPKENALTFLATASKAAIAGVTDVNTSVDVLTNVINAYKLPVADADKISDKLFATIVVGKTTMEELSGSMSKGTVAAASLGVSLDELLASVAGITLQGTSTAEAFTQVSSTITALLNPSEEMSGALKRIGFDSARAAIEQLGFGQTLDKVRQAIGNNDAELVKATRQVEAYRGVISLTGNNLDLYKKSLDAVEKSSGTTAKAYAENANTLETAQNQLSSSFTLLVENFESEFGTLEQTGNLLKAIANEIAGINGMPQVVIQADRLGQSDDLKAANYQKRLDELNANRPELENLAQTQGVFGKSPLNANIIETKQLEQELAKLPKSVRDLADAYNALEQNRKSGIASAIEYSEMVYAKKLAVAEADKKAAKLDAENMAEAAALQKLIDDQKEVSNAKIRAAEEEKQKQLKEGAEDALKYGADQMQVLEQQMAIQEQLLAVSKDPNVIESAKRYLEILEEQKQKLEEKLILEGGGVLPPKGSILGSSGVPGLSNMEELFKSESELETQSFKRRQDEMIDNLTKAEEKKAKVIVDSAKRVNADIEKIENDRNTRTFDGIQGALDNISNIQGEFGEKGFKVAQAAAIASATMSMFQAAQAAYASGAALAGPIGGAAFAATALAAGAANIAAIKGQTYAGAFEMGGMIPSGSFGLVGEAGPEFVSGPAFVTSAKKTSNALSEKSNGQSPVLNVILQNLPGQTAEVSTSEDGKTVTLAVKQTMAQLTKEAMQGGGTVFPAFMQSTGLKRR